MFYEMVSLYPEGSSLEKYISKAVGHDFGKFIPFLILCTVILGMPASAIIVGGFFAKYFGHEYLKLVIAFYLIFFGFITNILGISIGSKVQSLTTAILFFICLMIFLFTLPQASGNYSTLIPSFKPNGILQGILVAFWAFAGFENLSFLANKFENPKRDFLVSLVVGLTFCGFFYFALTANYAALIDYSEAKTELGLYQLAEKISASDIGALIVTIFSLFAVKVNFNSWVCGVSNLLADSAKENVIPSWVSKRNQKNTPTAAIVLLTTCFSISTLVYYYFPSFMNHALEMVSANFIFIYVLCLASFLKLSESKAKSAMTLVSLVVFILAMIQTGMTALYPGLILGLFLTLKLVRRTKA